MLRRPPTTISLTHDDIAAYEDARHAREQGRTGSGGTQDSSNATGEGSSEEARRGDPSDELRPFPSDRARGIRQPTGVTATPSGPSTATATGSPRAPARTRDERIGLNR